MDIPPVERAIKRKNTVSAIWYSPKVSAPSVRERYILNTKARLLVKIEKPVTVSSDFKRLLLDIINFMHLSIT